MCKWTIEATLNIKEGKPSLKYHVGKWDSGTLLPSPKKVREESKIYRRDWIRERMRSLIPKVQGGRENQKSLNCALP